MFQANMLDYQSIQKPTLSYWYHIQNQVYTMTNINLLVHLQQQLHQTRFVNDNGFIAL